MNYVIKIGSFKHKLLCLVLNAPDLLYDEVKLLPNHYQNSGTVCIFTICNALQCYLIPIAALTQSIEN